MKIKLLLVCVMVMTSIIGLRADDGSHLWLKYQQSAHGKVSTTDRLTPTLSLAIQALQNSWTGTPVILKKQKNKQLQKEGFYIQPQADKLVVTSPSDIGLLYASYYLLRSQSIGQTITTPIIENPFYERRLLNHWDNLDRTVEIGRAHV